MTIRLANLGLVPVPNAPAVNNLRGGNPALKHHVKQMLSAQDQPLVAGRRVVWQYGRHGSTVHSICDCDISASSDQIKAHPLSSDEVVIGNVDGFRVTPGHILAVSARCAPSGHVTKLVAAEPVSYYYDDGQVGSLRFDSVWSVPSETDTNATVTLDFAGPGLLAFGHSGHATQNGFAQLQEQYTLLFPTDMIFDPSAIEQFCRDGVEVALTVTRVGSCRPVDLVVYEVPYQIAFNDATSNKVPAHVYQNNGINIGTFPPDYAIEGQASGDPRMGVEWTNDVSREQNKAINPSGFHWDSGGESNAWSTTPDSGIALPASSEYTWLAFDAAGLAHGQRFHNSNDVVLPTTGAVLVSVSVLHSQSSGSDLTLTIYDENSVEVAQFESFSASTDGDTWDHFSCYLETGNSVLSQNVHTMGFESSDSDTVIKAVSVRAIRELE